MYKWLYKNWDKTFKNFIFVDVGEDDKYAMKERITLPCSLAEFKEAQMECTKVASSKLSEQFRRAIVDNFLDHCQGSIDQTTL